MSYKVLFSENYYELASVTIYKAFPFNVVKYFFLIEVLAKVC